MNNSNISLSSHVIISPGLDLEIDDLDNYQDVRMELNATGHNLVINSSIYYHSILNYKDIKLRKVL